jgi:hypothetical protein
MWKLGKVVIDVVLELEYELRLAKIWIAESHPGNSI